MPPPTSDQGARLDDGGDSGTTACVVMITPSAVVWAIAGDSRVIFARRNPTSTETTTTTNTHTSTTTNTTTNPQTQPEEKNETIPLSFDHKLADETKTKRIRAESTKEGAKQFLFLFSVLFYELHQKCTKTIDIDRNY